MSLPRERPVFVLPWIAVILASFAALPAVFGGRAAQEASAPGDVAGADRLVGEPVEYGPGLQSAPEHDLSRLLDLGSLAANGLEKEAPGEAAASAEGEAPAETAVAAREAGEAQQDAPREAGAVELPVEPSRQPELHRMGPVGALAVADAPVRARPVPARTPSASAAGSPEAAGPPVRQLPDGRLEVRLSPMALGYLAGEGLLPEGTEILPAIIDVSDPGERLLRFDPETLDATEAEPESDRTATRRQQLRRAKRLLASDPSRLTDFLARLTPGQLRALIQALRGRGIAPDRILGR